MYINLEIEVSFIEINQHKYINLWVLSLEVKP